MAPAAGAGWPQCFRFSPLGRDMPLFNHPIRRAPTSQRRPSRGMFPIACGAMFCAGISQQIEAGAPLALLRDWTKPGPVCRWPLQVHHPSLRSLGRRRQLGQLPPAGVPMMPAIDPHLGRIALPPLAGGCTHRSRPHSITALTPTWGAGNILAGILFAASPAHPSHGFYRAIIRLSRRPQRTGRRRSGRDHQQRPLPPGLREH